VLESVDLELGAVPLAVNFDAPAGGDEPPDITSEAFFAAVNRVT
jgi:hypothetical protein